MFYIGEDLDVLIELVIELWFYNGKVTGIADSESVTKEDLGLMMAGESLSSLQKEDEQCKL